MGVVYGTGDGSYGKTEGVGEVMVGGLGFCEMEEVMGLWEVDLGYRLRMVGIGEYVNDKDLGIRELSVCGSLRQGYNSTGIFGVLECARKGLGSLEVVRAVEVGVEAQRMQRREGWPRGDKGIWARRER